MTTTRTKQFETPTKLDLIAKRRAERIETLRRKEIRRTKREARR